MGFGDLKKSKGASGLSSIQQKLEKMGSDGNKQEREKDERFWRPTQDKTGVGSAIIRFLPTSDGDTQPFVELTEYAFQGPGGWYIEKALTSIGRKDPVQDKFSELWQTGIEANRNKAKTLKRKFSYISNILVVKDPGNPENEGKVFAFKYGKKIFDKIRNAMFPEQDELDESTKEGVNVFCPWEGANFKLRVAKVDGFPNYDKSEFASPSALFDGDDAKIKNLWDSQHKLAEFVAPDQFKDYDTLKKRLDRVLGLSLPQGADNVATASEAASKSAKKAPAKAVAKTEEVETESEDVSSDADVDDDISYLQQLASED